MVYTSPFMVKLWMAYYGSTNITTTTRVLDVGPMMKQTKIFRSCFLFSNCWKFYCGEQRGNPNYPPHMPSLLILAQKS